MQIQNKYKYTEEKKLEPQCNFNRGGSAWSHFCVYMSPTNPTAIGTNTNAAWRYEQMQYKQTKKHISNVVIHPLVFGMDWQQIQKSTQVKAELI